MPPINDACNRLFDRETEASAFHNILNQQRYILRCSVVQFDHNRRCMVFWQAGNRRRVGALNGLAHADRFLFFVGFEPETPLPEYFQRRMQAKFHEFTPMPAGAS